MEDIKQPQTDTLQAMRESEQRLLAEGELLMAVSHGQTARAEQVLASIDHLPPGLSVTDTTRNLKYHSVLLCAILREGARRGGAHPWYLEQATEAFIRKLDGLYSMDAIEQLALQMVQVYCSLVNQDILIGCSQPVRRAMLSIDMNLAGELSLRRLAAEQGINASYLSALFHRETGRTLTDFINLRRMTLAALLLESTNYQIQTVAQNCGVPDVNYFCKLFKKYHNQTPREYRRSVREAREQQKGQ